MDRMQYVCPKCGCTTYDHDQLQATGGTFSKLFDIQNKKYITITCSQCGYTEFYKARSSMGLNIIDFLMRR